MISKDISQNFEVFSKEDLIKLCKMYAKNWLAHDGCWFLSVEECDGMEKAIEVDKKAWEKFSSIEAKRIMAEFGIKANGGLDALKAALPYRLYASVNRQAIREEDGRLIFEMTDCRVQSARRAKGLSFFPCREVGVVEYSVFARTIDPRIKTRCLGCPPYDEERPYYCAWEFTI